MAFLLTTLAVVVTPGTGVVYTVTAGLSHGRRTALTAAVACTLSVVPHLVASVSGLAALLHASPVAYETVRYVGVGYLLFMAWATLRDKDALTDGGGSAAAPRSTRQVMVSGVLVNVLNPKVTMFFVAFLPQFVPSGSAGSVDAMLRLGGVFIAVTFVVFLAYGWCAAAVRERVLARPEVLRGVRRASAACFVGLGVRLAVA